MVRQLKRGLDWLKVKKVRLIDIVIAILLLFSYIFCSLYGLGINLDFNFDVNIEAGYFAVLDNTGSSYVIDRSKERLLKIKNNIVELEITDIHRHKIHQIENIVIDYDGNIYVHGLDWDDSGFLLNNEMILKYGPDGEYIDTLYVLNHEEGQKLDKSSIFNLRLVDGNIEYVKLDDHGFDIIMIENNEAILKSRYSFDQAIVFIQSIVVSPNTNKTYMVDKRGKILCADKEGIYTYYNFKDKTVPYDLVVGSDETIYFTDLFSQAVKKISLNKEIEEVFSRYSVYKNVTLDINEGVVYNVSIKKVSFPDGSEQDVICSIFNSDMLYVVKQNGEVMCNQKSFSSGTKYFAKKLFKAVVPLIFIFCLLALLTRLVLVLMFGKFNFKLLFLLQTTIIVTSTVVLINILPNVIPTMKDIIINGMDEQLLSVAYLTSKNLDIQKLSNINKLSDFMNDDYKDILKQLRCVTFRDNNTESISVISGRIEKYNNGIAISMVYSDNRTGVYYPLGHNEAKVLQEIYETKKSSVDTINFKTGQNLLVRVPVLNSSGEVVACVCIEKEIETIEQIIVKIVGQVIINLLAVVIVGMFILNEIIAFFAKRKEYRDNKEHLGEGCVVFPQHILRLSDVIFNMSINMSSVFLPMYILSFYSSQIGIPKVLAATIPLSINVAFILLASTWCLRIFNKFGFRKTLIFAVCCSIFSNAILATATSYYIMTLALLVNGLGFGLLNESKRSYLAKLPYQERNDIEVFCLSGAGSGKFFGIFVGGFLISILDYNQVFWMSVFIDIISLIFCIYFCKTYVETKLNSSDNKSKIKTLKFLFSKEVLSYLMIIPVIWGILVGFAGYYIPICGSINNFYENEISVALALVSFFNVFFAADITKASISRLKQNAVYVAILMALFAILLLICFNQYGINRGIFVVALLILGMAYSFGTNVCRYKFLTMDKVKEYGENRAQGIYILFIGIGATASSILFAWMLSMDVISSVCKFAWVCVILMAIYKVFFDRKK